MPRLCNTGDTDSESSELQVLQMLLSVFVLQITSFLDNTEITSISNVQQNLEDLFWKGWYLIDFTLLLVTVSAMDISLLYASDLMASSHQENL